MDASSLQLGKHQRFLGGTHAAALDGLLCALHKLSRILQDSRLVVPQQHGQDDAAKGQDSGGYDFDVIHDVLSFHKSVYELETPRAAS